VISSSRGRLPDNTQHSQQTDIHAPDWIGTHDLSRQAAVDLGLRSRGHWDRWSAQYWCLNVTPCIRNLPPFMECRTVGIHVSYLEVLVLKSQSGDWLYWRRFFCGTGEVLLLQMLQYYLILTCHFFSNPHQFDIHLPCCRWPFYRVPEHGSFVA